MKIGNILYHYTSDISSLLGILNNGFLVSYANEKFSKRDLKILMISFSNHSYLDAINEINYGEYAIGLNRIWGEIHQIHPVSYTTGLSLTASGMEELIEHSELGKTVKNIANLSNDNPNCEKSIVNKKLDRFFKINWSVLNEEDLKLVIGIFEDMFVNSQELQKYMKQIDVKTSSGKKRNSFLDREWRYVPDIGLEESSSIIFKKDKTGKINRDWQKWEGRKKPHQETTGLRFSLNDLRYIITKHKMELSNIYETLFRLYGKEKVIFNIKNGKLLICSKYDLERNI